MYTLLSGGCGICTDVQIHIIHAHMYTCIDVYLYLCIDASVHVCTQIQNTPYLIIIIVGNLGAVAWQRVPHLLAQQCTLTCRCRHRWGNTWLMLLVPLQLPCSSGGW